MIYLIGSLKNPLVPKTGVLLRENGFEVFDDWYAAGPEADDMWQEYEQLKGIHLFFPISKKDAQLRISKGLDLNQSNNGTSECQAAHSKPRALILAP